MVRIDFGIVFSGKGRWISGAARRVDLSDMKDRKFDKLEVSKAVKGFQSGLKAEEARIRELAFSTQPLDRDRMEHQARTLYRALDKPEPRIFWCDSAFQVFAIPYLIDRFAAGEEGFETFWKKAEDKYFELCTPHFLQTVNIGALQSRISKHFPIGAGYLPHERVMDVFEMVRRLNRDSAARDLLAQKQCGIPVDRLLFEAYVVIAQRTQIDVEAAPARALMYRNRQAHRVGGGTAAEDAAADEVASERWSVDELRWLARFGDVVDDGLDRSRMMSARFFGSIFGSSSWFYELCAYNHLYKQSPLGDEKTVAATLAAAELAQSIAWIQTYRHSLFLSERPTLLKLDENLRLHCADGPALRYADGYQQYALHGTSVSFYVIDRQPTVEMIDNERNIELRRIMLNRFGTQKYLFATGAKVFHVDECGTLYRKEMEGEEPILMVHVVNKTPEPDGNFHDFFIRVPPTMQTCRQAVAWTFGLEEHEYEPLKET